MDPNVILNLATLALKGRNLEEADSRYKQLVELTNNSTAWTGLGLVKMFKYATGNATMEEISFCFCTAKSVDPVNSIQIENTYLDACIGFSRELLSNLALAVEYQKKSEKKAIKSAIFAGISYVLRDSVKSSGFWQTLSAAQIAFNAGTAAINFVNAQQAKEVQERCWAGLVELVSSVQNIVSNTNSQFPEFELQLRDLFSFAKNRIKERTGIVLPSPFDPAQSSVNFNSNPLDVAVNSILYGNLSTNDIDKNLALMMSDKEYSIPFTANAIIALSNVSLIEDSTLRNAIMLCNFFSRLTVYSYKALISILNTPCTNPQFIKIRSVAAIELRNFGSYSSLILPELLKSLEIQGVPQREIQDTINILDKKSAASISTLYIAIVFSGIAFFVFGILIFIGYGKYSSTDDSLWQMVGLISVILTIISAISIFISIHNLQVKRKIQSIHLKTCPIVNNNGDQASPGNQKQIGRRIHGENRAPEK